MKLDYEPELSADVAEEPFCQTVRLVEDDRDVGVARWHATDFGVVQIMDMAVDPACRRQGAGERLLHAVVAQARVYYQSRKQPLRRVWMAVRQKSQVGGRAFLTDQGFHHISTTSELYRDEDLLIYSKAFT